MTATATAPTKRLSAADLDKIALRLADISQEEDLLRGQLKEQIAEYGFSPPQSEKSTRIETEHYQFTLSSASTTEIHDDWVERIRKVCPETLFVDLFTSTVKYKLAKLAHVVMANPLPKYAPRNFRQMFSRAVLVKESTPRLRVEAKEPS